MPQHDKLLRETYELARQNNKMLRSMKRAAFWGFIFKLLLWALLLGVPIFLYLSFFQPILEELLQTYSQVQNAGTQLQIMSGAVSVDHLQDLLQGIPGVDFSGTSQ